MPPVKKSKPQTLNKKGKEKESPKPVVATKKAVSGQLEKKIAKQQQREENKRGIVFIKNLPHGFFEEQLKGYFEQFGRVTRLRLARSRKTGGSKGYAFVEFQYPEVAQVAAETMNNYLMFQKLVKSVYIPPENQKFNYFKTSVKKVTNKAGKEIYVSSTTRRANIKVKEHNNWSDSNYQKRASRALKKLENLKKKFGHLGLDFSSIMVAPQEIEVETSNEENPSASEPEKKRGAKSKKVLKPADLLGTTINEDSEDDDYVPIAESDDGNSSNEESYTLNKKVNNKRKASIVKKTQKKLKPSDLLGTTIDEDSEDEDFVPVLTEDEKIGTKNRAKAGQAQKKSAIKGGKIEKTSIKKTLKNSSKLNANQPATAKNKKALQIAAAKEVAKPLNVIKENLKKKPSSKVSPSKKKTKK